MRINYNVSAIISNNALHNNEDLLTRSLDGFLPDLRLITVRIIRRDWLWENV